MQCAFRLRPNATSLALFLTPIVGKHKYYFTRHQKKPIVCLDQRALHPHIRDKAKAKDINGLTNSTGLDFSAEAC